MTPKSPPVAISVMRSKRSSPTVSIMTSRSSSSTVSVTTFESSPDFVKDQDVLVCPDGKAALHHVLSEVLAQPWWLLSEALERSEFDEIQDVLLMNQAERDTLTFLDANNVITPLPQAKKNKLLNVKLFSSYRKRISRPIIDWMKISKADFNSVALYMEEEKVTIPPCTMESHAGTIKPRGVTSATMVMPMTIPCNTSESHVNTSKPRNVASTIMATTRRAITAMPRNVTHTIMVTTTPTINSSSASSDVKVIDALDVNITDNPYIKAVNGPLVEQIPPKSPTYDFAPVKQQDTLHDFFHYVNQGTFSIPCGGKVYCPSPGMDPVAWP